MIDFKNILLSNNEIINNDDFKEYIKLIECSLLECRTKKENGNYLENHHILPVSLFRGYEKISENKVLLTYYEHLMAHFLLSKFTTGKSKTSMLFAVMCMKRTSYEQIRIMSEEQIQQYNESKIELKKILRDKWKGKNNPNNNRDSSGSNNPMHGSNRCGKDNPFYGKKHTLETKNKIGKKAKERNYNGSNNPHAVNIIFEDPLGNIYKIEGGFSAFCKKHSLPLSTMIKSLYKRRHPIMGRAAGWKAHPN